LLLRVGLPAFYLNNNRGKRSIGLNLTSDEGRQIALDLCKDADVIVRTWKEDPRFESMLAISNPENFQALGMLLAEVFMSLTVEDALARLIAADVPCGPILSAEEAIADPKSYTMRRCRRGSTLSLARSASRAPPLASRRPQHRSRRQHRFEAATTMPS